MQRSNLLEDTQLKSHELEDNIILTILLPGLICENMFTTDPLQEKRIKKSIIETQIKFYDMKVEKARRYEEYEKAMRYQKLSRGLRKYLKRNRH